jgi:hypothetical protein
METVSSERVRRGWRSRWAAIGAAVAVSLGAGGGFLIADAASGPESSIVMADPVRILDTRDPVDVGLPGPFVSATAQKLQVTGSISTSAGTQTVVPTGATGVLLNVTAVGATADGFISIRPGDATGSPATSSLNVTAGVTVPNAVQVALPTAGANAGKIDITWDALGVAGPTTDILIDVVGYTLAADFYTKAEADAKDLWAVVNADGTLARGSTNAVSSGTTVGGGYEVIFNRDVTGCAYTATVGNAAGGIPLARFAGVASRDGNPNGVHVRMWDQAGALKADSAFHVIVDCGTATAGTLVQPLSEGSDQ